MDAAEVEDLLNLVAAIIARLLDGGDRQSASTEGA